MAQCHLRRRGRPGNVAAAEVELRGQSLTAGRGWASAAGSRGLLQTLQPGILGLGARSSRRPAADQHREHRQALRWRPLLRGRGPNPSLFPPCRSLLLLLGQVVGPDAIKARQVLLLCCSADQAAVGKGLLLQGHVGEIGQGIAVPRGQVEVLEPLGLDLHRQPALRPAHGSRGPQQFRCRACSSSSPSGIVTGSAAGDACGGNRTGGQVLSGWLGSQELEGQLARGHALSRAELGKVLGALGDGDELADAGNKAALCAVVGKEENGNKAVVDRRGVRPPPGGGGRPP